MHRQASGYITLTFQISRAEGERFFSSVCLELGVASCGHTVEKAFSNLREAVELYLNTLVELGEREAVFQEREIEISSVRPVCERAIVARHDSFSRLECLAV